MNIEKLENALLLPKTIIAETLYGTDSPVNDISKQLGARLIKS